MTYLNSEAKLTLVLENIKTINRRNVLTAKSVNFDNFTLNLKMSKLNSQTTMTKAINQIMTFKFSDR